MRIGIIDYDAGNVRSVETALAALGVEHVRVDTPRLAERCDKLIFPGVGEAAAAMAVLGERGLDRALRRHVQDGRPLLGICIGCQLVLEWSEEGNTVCLALVPGKVRALPSGRGDKVPHMGWNRVTQVGECHLFEGLPMDSSFYFVHSYYPEPAKGEYVVGTTEHAGVRFASAFRAGPISAVQFHPEKSGRFGLKLLESFAFRE